MQGSERAFIKLKILNISGNYFNNSIITYLSDFTSLEALDLSSNELSGSFPSEGCKSLMRLERLESVFLGGNNFNKSIISCLSFLPSLKILDLSSNPLGNPNQPESSFPLQELSSLRELKTLDLSQCSLGSFTLKGTLNNLVHLNLDRNYLMLVDDIMRSMAAFPSLRFLSLKECNMHGELFANALPSLPDLEVLLLSNNFLSGILPIEFFTSFHHLKILDLSSNNFVGSISSTINSLTSLEVASFAHNKLNGSLPGNHGFCELKNLHELDLSANMFDGNLPECFKGLSSLKLFDISSNQLTGTLLSSLIANLTSLEYVDFSRNKFEGSFSFSTLSNHTKLEFFHFERDNDKFEVDTEEPLGWIPLFQLKFLGLSNWNINKGSVVPGFLLYQHKLRILDLSHNSLEGQFPNWLLKNNTKLERLILRNNSLQGVIRMALYKNANIKQLDMSENHMSGTIPQDIQKFIPNIQVLNFSSNALNDVIPFSILDLRELWLLDLSDNEFSGELPKGFLKNVSMFRVMKLSNNRLSGQVLSGNFSLGAIGMLHLNNNLFTGVIGNNTRLDGYHTVLDISDSFFTGMMPNWMSNMGSSVELLMRNNNLEGNFPCGKASFSFLDISQNSFSGPIPSCLSLQDMKHLHLASNKFTGMIPDAFRNLTSVLTLDISHNYLSGRIPIFLGELSNLRILNLGKNNFSGSIPKQLCQLTDASLIDLSSNSLTGIIPHCLDNITGHSFIEEPIIAFGGPTYTYGSVIQHHFYINYFDRVETQDEAQFTTKSSSLTYKGNVLDYMSGLDLSCNRLTGEIPKELGMLTHILGLNLSHNQLTGPIPVNFSNLVTIESLDLSSNNLSGKVPPELIKLTSLEAFNVSHNNLSGRLPEFKAQFSTFTKESYEGNPLLCGPPLENNCTRAPHMSDSSTYEEGNEKWYDIDKISFYGSSSSTWFVFMLGFAALLYINPYWRRRWLDVVEESMYTCYYFLYDALRKLNMHFHE